MYDVAEYLPQHPGGSDLIVPYLGMCIDEPFEENEHTKSARNLFKDLPKVGVISSSGDRNGNDSDTQASDKGESETLDKQDASGGIMGLDGYKLSADSWQPDYSKSLLVQLWNTKITRE